MVIFRDHLWHVDVRQRGKSALRQHSAAGLKRVWVHERQRHFGHWKRLPRVRIGLRRPAPRIRQNGASGSLANVRSRSIRGRKESNCCVGVISRTPHCGEMTVQICEQWQVLSEGFSVQELELGTQMAFSGMQSFPPSETPGWCHVFICLWIVCIYSIGQ